MTTYRLASIALLASAGVLATTLSALAAPNAVMNHDSDVYKSNSSASLVVNDVVEDDEVTVTKCTTSWCFIKIPGPDGWVKKKYLSPLDDSGDPIGGVPFSFGISVGPGGPTITFGTPGAPTPPPPPPAAPQACLFDGANFTSYSACYTPGDSDNNMAITGPGYNDAIGSIKLIGGAKIKVCTDAFFGGSCATFTSDKPLLGGFTDAISSFQVY